MRDALTLKINQTKKTHKDMSLSALVGKYDIKGSPDAATNHDDIYRSE